MSSVLTAEIEKFFKNIICEFAVIKIIIAIIIIQSEFVAKKVSFILGL